MTSTPRLLLLCVLGLLLSPVVEAAGSDRWWFGGAVGLGFGDVDYVSIEPILGYRVRPDLSVGGRLIYRYRDDNRFEPDLSTSDYGASLFARYTVSRPIFVQAEYEYLDYEYAVLDGTTRRDSVDSWLAGVGVAQRLGGRTGFFALALYNFSYSDDEPSPYDEPWVIRVGVSVGF
jgi:hypothetical protein